MPLHRVHSVLALQAARRTVMYYRRCHKLVPSTTGSTYHWIWYCNEKVFPEEKYVEGRSGTTGSVAFQPVTVVCCCKQKALDLHNVDVGENVFPNTLSHTDQALTRCGLAIIIASASMGSGTHGTMKRIRTGSFLTVLRLGFGTANPNAFTAYFLPKYVCRPIPISSIMAEKRRQLTSCPGNQRLHLKRTVGQLLADNHFISIPCIQCTSNMSTCQ
jgi:hypothetical protein